MFLKVIQIFKYIKVHTLLLSNNCVIHCNCNNYNRKISDHSDKLRNWVFFRLWKGLRSAIGAVLSFRIRLVVLISVLSFRTLRTPETQTHSVYLRGLTKRYLSTHFVGKPWRPRVPNRIASWWWQWCFQTPGIPRVLL